MVPEAARYLLRIDDLCPTIAAGRWREYAALIQEFKLRPILAIVPENRDPELCCSRPDPRFWQQMRELHEAGAAVALHGYTHLCESRGRSLLPLAPYSEFAGVDASVQRNWIRRGVDTLKAEGLMPSVWVAPRHGFDRHTIGILREEQIRVISDGLARWPFLRDEMIWIPQQLWTPEERGRGVWTICVHPNCATADQLRNLHTFLASHAAQFISVQRILEEPELRPLAFTERIHGAMALQRIRARRLRKRLLAGPGAVARY